MLLVAPGERMARALTRYLLEHRVQVEDSSIEEVMATAFVSAPDLLVLAGDAAADAGAQVLAALAANSVTATLPVVLITEGDPHRQLSSFRHGVVAVIERSASADEMARRIAAVAHGLPERSGETEGTFGAGPRPPPEPSWRSSR